MSVSRHTKPPEASREGSSSPASSEHLRGRAGSQVAQRCLVCSRAHSRWCPCGFQHEFPDAALKTGAGQR